MVFLTAMLLMVLCILGYLFYKVDFSAYEFKEYFKTREGKGATASALKALLGLSLIYFTLSAFEANADDEYFEYTEIFLGVDSTFKESPQCRSGSTDDKLTSNLGVTQHIYTWKDSNVFLTASWQHHSCVIGRDQNTYDAFGFKVTKRFDW